MGLLAKRGPFLSAFGALTLGEDKFTPTALVKAIHEGIAVLPQQSGDLRVATPGGVFQVRWDDNASASALGQLAFFGDGGLRLRLTRPTSGL